MSLKKKLFRTNMAVIFASLAAFMVIMLVVAKVFEDLLENQLDIYIKGNFQNEEEWLAGFFEEYGYVFLAGVLAAGIAAIAFILIAASFVTRKTNQTVMRPIELLTEGTRRIKDGNLTEEIEYSGEEEFEELCRTFNDMQSRILEDQRQRIKTEKARTDMITGISHDLRTPLTSIQGYIKGVMDGVADTEEKKRNYLETAYEATLEMNILIRKLFDFSRLESGQMPFYMVRADLAEYVMSYTAQKEAAYDPKNTEISVRVTMGEPNEILMDTEQIRRVLDNLLENSIKYANAAPVRISIDIKRKEDQVILEWKDNGQDVPEEDTEKIFERFYRCDEARQEKGSGVGLYVVRYIMERHGGSVKAENDNGLCIRLSFPASETNDEFI